MEGLNLKYKKYYLGSVLDETHCFFMFFQDSMACYFKFKNKRLKKIFTLNYGSIQDKKDTTSFDVNNFTRSELTLESQIELLNSDHSTYRIQYSNKKELIDVTKGKLLFMMTQNIIKDKLWNEDGNIKEYYNEFSKIKAYVLIVENELADYYKIKIYPDNKLSFEAGWRYFSYRQKWYQNVIEPTTSIAIQETTVFNGDDEDLLLRGLEKDKDFFKEYFKKNNPYIKFPERIALIQSFSASIINNLMERRNYNAAIKFFTVFSNNLFEKMFRHLFCISFFVFIFLLGLLLIDSNNDSFISDLITSIFISSILYSVFLILAYPCYFIHVNKSKKQQFAIFDLGLLTPKLTISIIAGWLSILPFSNDVWQINRYIYEGKFLFWSVVALLICIVSMFFLGEIKGFKPKITLRESIIRLSFIFSRILPLSFVIGTILLMFSFLQVCEKSEVYPKSIDLEFKIDSLVKNEKLYYWKKKSNSCDTEYPIDMIAKHKSEIDQVGYRLPFIVINSGFISSYIRYSFPYLLIITGLVTFLVVFFIQYIMESRVLNKKF